MESKSSDAEKPLLIRKKIALVVGAIIAIVGVITFSLTVIFWDNPNTFELALRYSLVATIIGAAMTLIASRG